jgi:hypothetical protein
MQQYMAGNPFSIPSGINATSQDWSGFDPTGQKGDNSWPMPMVVSKWGCACHVSHTPACLSSSDFHMTGIALLVGDDTFLLILPSSSDCSSDAYAYNIMVCYHTETLPGVCLLLPQLVSIQPDWPAHQGALHVSTCSLAYLINWNHDLFTAFILGTSAVQFTQYTAAGKGFLAH